jgi:ABC-type branched-subunit amino acid transport system substrate-binding protein
MRSRNDNRPGAKKEVLKMEGGDSKKIILESIVGIICFFIVAGGMVFSSTKACAQKMDPIKIGAPVDLSGNYQAWGVQIKRTLELIMDEVNEKGVYWGEKWSSFSKMQLVIQLLL